MAQRGQRSASAVVRRATRIRERNPLFFANVSAPVVAAVVPVEDQSGSRTSWTEHPPPARSAVVSEVSASAAAHEVPPPARSGSMSWTSPEHTGTELMPDVVVQLAPALLAEMCEPPATRKAASGLQSTTMATTISAPGATVSVADGRLSASASTAAAALRRTSAVSFPSGASLSNTPTPRVADGDRCVGDEQRVTDAAESTSSFRSAAGGRRRSSLRATAATRVAAPSSFMAAAPGEVSEGADVAHGEEGCPSRTDRRSSLASAAAPVGAAVSDRKAASASPIRWQMAQAAQEMELYMSNVCVMLRCWERVGERYEAVVEDLATVFAAEHPEYALLFVTSSLRAQAREMLNMIGGALAIVARPNEMFSTLLEVGALHRRYNVCEEHFRALQSVFMRILPKYVPAELQASCEAAWTPFWRIVVPLLVHGRESARGDWHEAEQEKLFLAESRTVMAVIAEAQAVPTERGSFIVRLLNVCVAADASMERFSQLRDHRTAVRVFDGIVRLLEGSEDKEATELRMEQLSLDHVLYGVDSAAMQLFRQPFIETCGLKLRKANRSDLWTPQTRRSLGAFWDFVAATWATGFEHTQRSREAQAERAPSGKEPFCLMFTDIEASTRLWEHNPTVMGEAVEAHHRIVRSAIADYGAYEVKTVGDSFVIAAKDALIALKIALAIQLELMRGPIVPGFEMVDNVQGSGPAECWRNDSLRVRIGIHYCRDAAAVYDSVQRRFDYYGQCVNCTARTESAACGGQILITEDAVEVLRAVPEYTAAAALGGADGRGRAASVLSEDMLSLAEGVVVQDWGIHAFKGIERRIQLFSVLPRSLGGRVFDRCGVSVSSCMLSPTFGSVAVRGSSSLEDSASTSASDVEQRWRLKL
ncbi:Adenylate and Guanylate cyclase catalytic domain containing protein [Novymonas esmeraldas]|uniref:Adenylate and Guanylate cyclase catalytic domain containing protein n=1 Tax=Novymonas esmeraldas TaxID=1808958 RepID=A0AAW0EU52_9TRYP